MDVFGILNRKWIFKWLCIVTVTGVQNFIKAVLVAPLVCTVNI